MIIEDKADIERIGNLGGNEKEFTFKLTAKAFQLTIAGIYQNKVGAVVREIFSNAHDSHTKAGNPDPVIIRLPYGLSPYFIVEDNGVGLSPEDVMHYYSTVFDSTKDQSNDEIGAFGLGSKSPFTITDSFEIETRWNGTQYNFITLKNENGIPTIMQLGQLETSRPNGVTIKVPIAENDFSRFENEVKEQLKFFENKPIIYKFDEVCEDFEWKNFYIDNDLGAVKVLNRRLRNSYTQTTWIVMGGVGYPVDLGQLGDDNIERIVPTFNGDIIIDMPMGSVEIESSREGLEYTTKTIAAVKDFFNSFFADYEKSVIDKIKGFKTNYEIYAYIAPIVEASTYWQRAGYDKLKYLDGSNIITDYGTLTRKMHIAIPDNYRVSVQHRRTVYSSTKIERTNFNDKIPFADLLWIKNIILVDAKVKYTASRIRDAIEVGVKTLVVETRDDSYDFTEFLDALKKAGYPLPPIKHIADLTYTPIQRVTSGERDEYVAGIKEHGNSMRPSTLDDMDTDGFYVYYTGNHLEDEELNPDYLPLLDIIYNVDGRPKIYNIMKSGRKYVEKLEDSGLRHINHFIEESINRKLSSDEIETVAKYAINDLSSTMSYAASKIIDDVAHVTNRVNMYMRDFDNKLYKEVRKHFAYDDSFSSYRVIRPFYSFYFNLAKEGKVPYNRNCERIRKRVQKMLKQLYRANVQLRNIDTVAIISTRQFDDTLKNKLINIIIEHNKET